VVSASVGRSGKALITSGALTIWRSSDQLEALTLGITTRKADLLLEIDAVQRQRPGNDGEGHKVVIREQFGRGKRRKRIDEERTRGFELADGEEVEAAVDLEAIATVPVAALLDELVRFREVGGDELVVAKEESDANEREDDVYSRT
jgi:hypothetical protein